LQLSAHGAVEVVILRNSRIGRVSFGPQGTPLRSGHANPILGQNGDVNPKMLALARSTLLLSSLPEYPPALVLFAVVKAVSPPLQPLTLSPELLVLQ
jgi:hypothetical protein